MNETLVQRVRVYLEPPACRVPLAAVSIAFLNGQAIQSGIITAAGEDSDASPTPAYLHIIVDGAREHGLPADYCERIANLKTLEDR